MKKYLPVINLLTLALSALVHLLSYTDFFPFTLSQVRESRALLFLPDSISLVTWLLIYLSLLSFAIYQSRPAAKDLVEATSWYFFFTNIGKITWTILFIYGWIWLSTLAMVMTLAALVMLYIRLTVGSQLQTLGERLVIQFPFSMYLAWTTVLTIVNVAASLYDSGYTDSFIGISAEFWTVYLVILLTGLTFVFLFILNDSIFTLTIAWGMLTIFIRPFDTPIFERLQSLNLVVVDVFSFTAFALLLLLVVGRAILARNKKAVLVAATA